MPDNCDERWTEASTIVIREPQGKSCRYIDQDFNVLLFVMYESLEPFLHHIVHRNLAGYHRPWRNFSYMSSIKEQRTSLTILEAI